MWQKSYRDYKPDEPLTKQTVESGKGIIGCEMHDLNGWGEAWHSTRKRRPKGLMHTLLQSFFGLFQKRKEP